MPRVVGDEEQMPATVGRQPLPQAVGVVDPHPADAMDRLGEIPEAVDEAAHPHPEAARARRHEDVGQVAEFEHRTLTGGRIREPPQLTSCDR